MSYTGLLLSPTTVPHQTTSLTFQSRSVSSARTRFPSHTAPPRCRSETACSTWTDKRDMLLGQPYQTNSSSGFTGFIEVCLMNFSDHHGPISYFKHGHRPRMLQSGQQQLTLGSSGFSVWEEEEDLQMIPPSGF